MKILGISAFYHDSAAAVVVDGVIIAAAQEERFTRKKHDESFPTQAIQFCLNYAGLSIDELDAVVFYDKPMLKFERLLETYYAFAPKGLRSFIQSMPVWLKEKLFLKKIIKEELEKIQKYDQPKLKLLFPEHHLSHAASAFYPSPFQEAAILTIDGVGEWATASISHGKGNEIKVLKELRFPHSLGLLYSAFTYFLGFKVNSGEYKLMGLAPYGNPESEEVARFKDTIKKDLVSINNDGSLWLNQSYFDYATGLQMAIDSKWEKLFGFVKRKEEDPIEQHHSNLGLAIQQITEEVVLQMAQEAKRLTSAKHLCLSGGVALNCVANGKLLNEKLFDNLFIQPAAGDAGGALGAALAAEYIYFKNPRTPFEAHDSMQGSYLGPEYSSLEIEQMARTFKAVIHPFDSIEKVSNKTAQLIAEGNVVGWFQGRMEFGPRALGNRSILADARQPAMQQKLNLKIKYREGFRPFAPAVLAEDVAEYFNLQTTSPYMLFVAPIKNEHRKEIPANYAAMPMMERLYIERSTLPAITHLDFSARIQTVHRETNQPFWTLLNTFKKQTGCPLLINTSFNVRGEPPVCTPAQAYRCFMRTEMDALVLGNYLFLKTEQPKWTQPEDWKTTIGTD